MYEAASAKKGRLRAIPKRAPPSGGEPDDRAPRHRQARRVGELGLRHDGLDRAARPRAEEDGCARIDERDHEDQPVPRMARRDRHRQHHERRGGDCVGGDAEQPAVEAVGGDSGRHAQEHDRRELDGADVAGLRRRPGQEEGEQRVREPGDRAPEEGEELPGLVEEKVAVAPQRDELGHASMLAGANSSGGRAVLTSREAVAASAITSRIAASTSSIGRAPQAASP